MKDTNIIQITQVEYDSLIEVFIKYTLLVDSFIKGSTLNSTGDGLSFSSYKTDYLFEIMEKELCEARLEVLREEAENGK